MTDRDLDTETRAALADVDVTTNDTNDPQVDVLVEDIEITREEMTGTVEEIGDRLDPRNIVDNAKETVRAATVGKVEDMASSAQAMVGDAGETVREAGTGILDTITRNPVPAAMVGIGLGWLLKNRQSKPSWERYAADGDAYGRSNPYLSNASGGASQGAGSMIGQAQDKAGQVADKVGRTVGDAADQVGSTVGSAASQVGDVASQVPYQVRSTTRELGDRAERIFESSPLAVGAIAVAVGAAVGLALPVTETERRAIRQPARQVLAKAEEAATGALEQVEQKAQDAEQQAIDEDRQARPH